MLTNDVTIAAYPKSGITYLSFLLATARAVTCGLKIRPTFFNIDWLVIDSHKMQGKDYATIWNDGMGNFIKTHNPASNAPNVIYLLRNPYDTLKSYFHFERQLGNQQTVEAFLEMKIPEWLRHVKSWLIDNRNVTQSIYLIEYEAINEASIKNLGHMLGFNWGDQALTEALRKASMDDMGNSERTFSSHNPVYRRFELEFVRRGKERQVEGFEDYREMIKERTHETYCAVSRLAV